MPNNRLVFSLIYAGYYCSYFLFFTTIIKVRVRKSFTLLFFLIIVFIVLWYFRYKWTRGCPAVSRTGRPAESGELKKKKKKIANPGMCGAFSIWRRRTCDFFQGSGSWGQGEIKMKKKKFIPSENVYITPDCCAMSW